MKDVIDVLKNAKAHILAGVSYLIPVVVAGGILTGLGVAVGGTTPWEETGTLGYFLFMLGKTGLNLMPAVISAFIAYSIADKGAIGPAIIVGQVSQDVGAGFLGGVLMGFFIGILVFVLNKVNVPKSFRALKTIIIIPTIATLVGAAIMQFAIGEAIVALIAWLTAFVEGLGTGNIIVLGIAMGIIGSFDLGLFGSKALGAVALTMLATVDPVTGLPAMIGQRFLLASCTANTVPPLACALATMLAPKKFRPSEREAGKAALIMGCFAITEGSIPLALADAKVYAGCIVGATVGTVCTWLFGAGTIVNWGGIPTFPGCTSVPMYLLALAIGTIAGAAFMIVFKKKPVDAEVIEEDVKVSQTGEEFNLEF